MKWLPRSAWSFVVLAFVTGCGDEPTSTAVNPGTSTPGPAGRDPAVPPVTKGEPTKEGAPKDTAKPAPAKADDAPKLEPPKTESTKEKTSDATTLTDKELASIKELPPADQAIAIKQAVCPVSGDHLGGEMGKPIKVTAEGRTFFLCCDGCQDAIKKDPKAVIAKLDAQAQKK